MKRDAWKQLQEWKVKEGRKPLLVKGARQVGKTYLIRKFAETHFSNLVYVNCDNEPRVQTLFAEEYVLEQLKAVPDTPVYYWSNNSSSAELDFVIQHGPASFP